LRFLTSDLDPASCTSELHAGIRGFESALVSKSYGSGTLSNGIGTGTGTGILRRTHLQFLTKFFGNFLILLAEVLILLQQCLNRKVVSQIQANKNKQIGTIRMDSQHFHADSLAT
jgi:hypothetical protein